MKNAFVLVDHHGDNGTVREGSILTDLSDQRFSSLEKRGLVREAKAAELRDDKSAATADNKKAPEPSNKAKD